jgi:hypothetical protein
MRSGRESIEAAARQRRRRRPAGTGWVLAGIEAPGAGLSSSTRPLRQQLDTSRQALRESLPGVAFTTGD